MKFTDAIINAVESLLSDKLRSFLSMLGVIISISAIALIQILGYGVGNSVSDLMIERNNQIKAYLNIVPSGNDKNVHVDNIGNYDIPDEVMLTNRFLNGLEDKFDDERMQRVYSYEYLNTEIEQNNGKKVTLSIQGCTQAYLDDSYIELSQGVMFDKLSKDDINVAIVSERFLKEVCKDEDFLNKTWNYFDGNKFCSFRIVGIYKDEEYDTEIEDPIKIYIPIQYLTLHGVAAEEKIEAIDFRMENVEDADKIREEIANYYNEYYNDKNWSLKVDFDIDERENINKYMQGAFYIVTIIGFLTFLVGAMCIVNMMIITIDEKLTEIGISRALGARKKDIYFEILIEAIVTVLIGVVIGIILGCIGGYAIMLIISNMEDGLINMNYFSVPWMVIILAVLISFVVGILASIAPIIKVKDFTICEILNRE